MNRPWHALAVLSLLALITLCVLWELILAPLRPNGSWLVLKAIPLCFFVSGILKKNLYTYQLASMCILLYAAEGAVRVMSDAKPSAYLGGLELLLSSLFFISALAYVAPYKRAFKARQAKKESNA